MGFVRGLFSLISGIVEVAATTTVIAGIGAVTVLYLTKPTDKSFDESIKRTFRSEIAAKDDNFVTEIFKDAAASLAPIAADRHITDYVLVKVAHVRNDADAYYIGALNDWFLIDKRRLNI